MIFLTSKPRATTNQQQQAAPPCRGKHVSNRTCTVRCEMPMWFDRSKASSAASCSSAAFSAALSACDR